MNVFELGKEYRRADIHNLYGGQRQGGISTPRDHKMIFLFTSSRGKDHGYSDGWQESGIFLYTGEGQYGDMEFIRGNKHIKEHESAGRQIYVFKQTRKGYVCYIGQVVYLKHHFQEAHDTNGKIRKRIVFELKPVGEFLP
jgi:5-methylcytosine-specific restriction enzyme A